MALPFFLINCEGKNKAQEELNNKLIKLSSISKDLLTASIWEFEESKAHAVLEIECDYSRLDESQYIKAIYKFEDLLTQNGVKSISYRLIDKGGSLRARGNEQQNDLLNGGLRPEVKRPKVKQQNKQQNKQQKQVDDVGNAKKANMSNIVSKGRAEGISGEANIAYMQIKGQFVRLRKEPKVTSKTKVYLFDKTVVKIRWKSNIKFKIKSTKDYWYKVSTANKAGWVYGKYLAKTKSRRASSYLTNNKIYLEFIKEKPKLLRGVKEDELKDGTKGRVEIGLRALQYITKEKRYKIRFVIVGEDIKWGSVDVVPRKGVDKGVKSRRNPNEPYIHVNNDEVEKNAYDVNAPVANKAKELERARIVKEGKEVKEVKEAKKVKDVKVMSLYHGGSSSPSEWWIKGRVEEDFDWVNVINKARGGKRKEDKGKRKEDKGKRKEDKEDKELKPSLSMRKASRAQMRSLSYKGQSDYNLLIEMNEYVRNGLTAGDYKLAQVLLKLIEIKLMARGQKAEGNKADVGGPRFHRKFNSYYDTIKLSLENIDFDNKKVVIKVKRTSPNFGGETKELVKEKLYLDFKHMSKKYKEQDYDKYDEIYYSEVVHALNSLGVSGYDKKELVGLAKMFVKLLLRQKYI